MLYYSHVNEDNRVERNLLLASMSGTIVAVAGSGERVLALLDCKPVRHVHVIDVNDEALFLLQLKLAALKILSTENYLRFCGHGLASAVDRKNWFGEVQHELTAACRQYWQNKITSIEKGISNAGHFERFLRRVRPSVNLFLGQNFQSILTGAAMTGAFPRKRWNLLLRLFSFRIVYRLWGNKDIAFVSPDAIVKQIPRALDELVENKELQSCFMAHLIFKGHIMQMKPADLPPSLQKPVLQQIKSRLTSSSLSIHYHHTDVLSFITSNNAHLQEPVFYSLSDILSFENIDYLKQISAQIKIQDHTLVWRAFLRNRMHVDLVGNVLENKNMRDYSHDESTRMYQVFSSRNKV